MLDLKTWLQGAWVLERSVEDLRGQQSGKMTGQGAFLHRQDGLLYEEKAYFSMGNYQDEVEQSYLYVFYTQSCAQVCFIDGRHFHRLDLSTGQSQALHYCGHDIYRGDFRVLTSTCFHTSWHIKGPRKKIVIETQFTKI